MHKSRYGGRVWIEHYFGPLEPRRDLQEELKVLAVQRGIAEVCEAGDVPSRAVEPRNDALGDRVGHARNDDRNRPRLSLEGNGRGGPGWHDDVGLQADQLLGDRSYLIDV